MGKHRRLCLAATSWWLWLCLGPWPTLPSGWWFTVWWRGSSVQSLHNSSYWTC